MRFTPTAALFVLGALSTSVLGQEDVNIAARAPATSVFRPLPLPTLHCSPIICRPLEPPERRSCIRGRCVDVQRRIACFEQDIVCPQ
ncbi:hypothetical protein C8R44DRAFT_871350 [Mycena epipterygia]|nr:hypothetical protein C8R44DRAFT_871350 [Mycena epipterygia]